MSSSFGAWQAREWEAGRDPSWIHDDPLAYRRLMDRCMRLDAIPQEPPASDAEGMFPQNTPPQKPSEDSASNFQTCAVAAFTTSSQSHAGTE
jgi:hypothetical protein